MSNHAPTATTTTASEPDAPAPIQQRPHLNFLTERNLPHFGHCANNYHSIDITVNIAGQNSLPSAVYNQIVQLSASKIDLTKGEFTRMWKTLLLKRVQDVFQQEKKRRPANMIRLGSSILIPGPLADTLSMLGQHISTTNGGVYHIVPPDRSPVLADWSIVDNGILAKWIQLMYRIKFLYATAEFPSMNDYDGRPLVFTTIQDTEDCRQVRSFSNEPKPTDVLIRFVNDDLFVNLPFSYENCHLHMAGPLHLVSVVGSYVGSHVRC